MEGTTPDEASVSDVVVDLSSTYAQTVINQLLHGGGGETAEAAELTKISSNLPEGPNLEVMNPIKHLVNNATRNALQGAGN